MGYINVFLSKPCRIFVKNRQLVVEGETDNSFPIEDLNSVLIESGECSVTSTALRSLADAGVVLFVCDEKHLPNGVMLPFNAYYRPLKTLELQLSISKPKQKQLWQSIVKQKINNQATCLALCCKEQESRYLFDLVKRVNSDDAKNTEATAANYYFKKLFGSDFERRNDNFINSVLNYGYTIVRGLIARTLAVYGFETSIGLHHVNQLNNFNLADDIIEPYRPVVDLIAYSMTEYDEFTPEIKKILFNLINQDVKINGQIHALSYATELTVQSLKVCFEKDNSEIMLPELLPLGTHRYE